MVKARDQSHGEKKPKFPNNCKENRKRTNELAISCMLNTEIGAVLAVIRRNSFDSNSSHLPPNEDSYDSPLLNSLKLLRAHIFNPQREWHKTNPSTFLSPFLDVLQSDDIPSSATGVALASILKILRLNIFDEKTPGAREAINSVVYGITNCRLEKTDSSLKEAVLSRILQVLVTTMKNPASILLTDHTVCTIVNTCFQVIQQSASRGDLLQRNARHMIHELIQLIFSRLPGLEVSDEGISEFDLEENEMENGSSSSYGIYCMVDIFHFLCTLLNVVEIVDQDGTAGTNSDEDVQLFALVLINTAIELGGESIGKHRKLLRLVQDDLFHHVIHYGTCCSPLVLSMICSTVLNLYHYLRRFLKLQLEAFFTFVVLRIANGGSSPPLQEVAIEGLVSFCRQPDFIFEMYVNYDCDPLRRNVFEDIGKLLCKSSFLINTPVSGMQAQALEGVVAIVQKISDNIGNWDSPGPRSTINHIKTYRPFWEEKCENEEHLETWIEFIRLRKLQKRKIMIAANHFNRDEKKGLQFLKISHLSSDPPDPKSIAFFYRYTPGLDKNKIGDYLGDPDELHIQVLKEFTETFDFSGIILDTALRTYLETFRLPGESQKIQRILEAFSERFYDQQSSEIFVSKDAVFILCYSLIMLNTDQHNPQVKKKMTEEEFIRNNRAINGGKDLPREYLSELFQSISNNAITLFGQSGTVMDMNPTRWDELIKRSKIIAPFIERSFEPCITTDLFACISGPSMAALSTIFEHSDEDEILHECLEGLMSIAISAQYGLQDILDELLASFCKSTALLNPYASAEETLFAFNNDLKPKMATVAVFSICNLFGTSIRSGWKNMVDCLLKLKRLKLLPQSMIDPYNISTSTNQCLQSKSEQGLMFPSTGNDTHTYGMLGSFSQFLMSENKDDSIGNSGCESDENLTIIHQLRIGNIFRESSKLPDESLLMLAQSLIFAAAGKGQKFVTDIEEEETIGFCWDLLVTISILNLHRFSIIWPFVHDYLLDAEQFPRFSPCLFSEKAILGLFKICLRLFNSPKYDKLSEELIFKSINYAWKLVMELFEPRAKEIIDPNRQQMLAKSITQSIIQILVDFPGKVQTQIGWKTLLQLLSITSRNPETYEQGVEAVTSLISDGIYITKWNYAYFIDSAFGFATLRIIPTDKSTKILDLMANSVHLIVQWYGSAYTDPGSESSNISNSSIDDGLKTGNSNHFAVNLFIKLGETLRKTSLVRREEIRNHSLYALRKSFAMSDEIGFTSPNCMHFFNHVLFAMVDDLHEKNVEYSMRENSDREIRSMVGTLKIAMELLVDIFIQFLSILYENPGFRTFWMGMLRRMGTCMKADFGVEENILLRELVPRLLKKMIVKMKEKNILVPREEDDLWEITYIQIQWIAPSVKEELFPEDVL